MNASERSALLDKAVDITIAKMSNSSMIVNEDGGKDVADFIEAIYNKLVDLSTDSNEFE